MARFDKHWPWHCLGSPSPPNSKYVSHEVREFLSRFKLFFQSINLRPVVLLFNYSTCNLVILVPGGIWTKEKMLEEGHDFFSKAYWLPIEMWDRITVFQSSILWKELLEEFDSVLVSPNICPDCRGKGKIIINYEGKGRARKACGTCHQIGYLCPPRNEEPRSEGDRGTGEP